VRSILKKGGFQVETAFIFGQDTDGFFHGQ